MRPLVKIGLAACSARLVATLSESLTASSGCELHTRSNTLTARRNLPNGLCYLYTEPYDNERGYKGEAVCVEPDDFCSYGERRTDNG